jgi:II/X family phage/plasmid replication protein
MVINMIDWVAGKIQFAHTAEQMPCGSVVSVTSDGDIEWKMNKRVVIEGSYSSKFTLRSDPTSEISPGFFSRLEFSGNPVKFLQGHNIWGSSDLTGLAYEAIVLALQKLNLRPTEIELAYLFSGNYSLSRVDINYMYSMGSLDNVNQWLSAAEYSARTRQGKGHFSGNTLYFQKKSTRWSLKFYSKGLELKAIGHQLPKEFLSAKSFHDYANDKLRCELTLRTKELKKLGLDKGSSWGDNEPYNTYVSYMGRLEMSEQKQLDDLVVNLPAQLRSTYLTWKEGYDVKSLLHRATFYRHRKKLLEYGVDISIQSNKKPSNVVPLMRVIEAVPAEIPEWAYGTKYYFEPRKSI